MLTKFWSKNLKERNQVEDLGIDGDNIIMNIKETGQDSRQGPVADSCEHDNELPGSIKGGEFLDCLSGY
jgi:hypothetical protein